MDGNFKNSEQAPQTAPTPKLLDQARNLLRLLHYSIHTERSYLDWIGHKDVATTMIYTHILQQGGLGVPSPLDDLLAPNSLPLQIPP